MLVKAESEALSERKDGMKLSDLGNANSQDDV